LCEPSPYETHCVVCDKVILNTAESIRLTCSPECLRHRAKLRRTRPLSYDKVCVACGKTFTIYTPDKASQAHRKRKTCSHECFKQHARNMRLAQKRIWPGSPCIICGKLIHSHYKAVRKTCSHECLSECCRRRQAGKTVPNRKKTTQQLRTAVLHTLTCIICGKMYTLTPKQFHPNRKTCSFECRNKQISIVNKNQRNSPEAYAIIGEKARTHPKTGHFMTNLNAKEYSFKSPTGETYNFRNISLFVDMRRDLFSDIYGSAERVKYKTVCGALMRLAPWSKYRQASWHGWTWYDPSTADPQPQDADCGTDQGRPT